MVSVGSRGGPRSSLLGVNVLVPRSLCLARGEVNRLKKPRKGNRDLAGRGSVEGRGSSSVSGVK